MRPPVHLANGVLTLIDFTYGKVKSGYEPLHFTSQPLHNFTYDFE